MRPQPAEEHLQLIERLRGGTAARLGPEQVRPMLAELIRHAGAAYWIYGLPHVVKVHRSRPMEAGDDWRSFTARDLGPPPPDKVTAYARCNGPGQSLLYCSLEENIALAEMQAAQGQTHLITTYLLDREIRLMPIGELDFFRRTGGLTYFGGGGHSKVARHYAGMLQDINVTLIDAFLADEFMRYAETDAVYFLTSAAADILFNEAEREAAAPDALFYPSVVFRSGVNFAITPNAYASKVSLVVEETKMVRITEVLGYGLYRYELVATLESCTGGRLSWNSS